MAKNEKTYTEALNELQEILDKIESGDMDIDELTDQLKRASALLNSCKDKLYKVDSEVKKILDKLD